MKPVTLNRRDEPLLGIGDNGGLGLHYSSGFSRELPPLFLLALIACLFFKEVLFSGDSLFGSDFTLQFQIWKQFILDHLDTHGALPQWNPYLFSGTPFIANIQASMFYPLGILYYLFPTATAYLYTIFLHVVLAMVFMYVFMRGLAVSRSGACLAAAAFSLNGYLMGHLYAGHSSFVQAYIWIPLLFHVLHRFLRTQRWHWAVLGGLILGIEALGGFPQITFYTALALGGFTLFAVAFPEPGKPRKRLKTIVGFTVMSATALGIAAVQLLPTMEFAGLSTRGGGVDYAFATYDSLHPAEMVTFLIPEIFGNVVNATYWRSGEVWHFWETCGYVGLVPLCLLFVPAPDRRSSRLRRFFLALVALSLLLALGKHNPLYAVVYRLPGFHSFRIPAQILFLYVFGLSVLAGMGMDGITKKRFRLGRPMIVFLAIAGILFLLLVVACNLYPYAFFFSLFKTFAIETVGGIDSALLADTTRSAVNQGAIILGSIVGVVAALRYQRMSGNTFRLVILAVAVVDLGLFGTQFIVPDGSASKTGQGQMADRLHKEAHRGRVITDATFGPNEGLKYRFASVLGYDPLILDRYAKYVLASEGLPLETPVVNLSQIKRPDSKLMKLLNVRQVVRNGDISTVDHPMPYATLVHRSVVRSGDEALSFMLGPDFDPQSMVVLEAPHSWAVSPEDRGTPLDGSCRIVGYESRGITIETSANRRCYLVLSEVFYPGWRATVDGKSVPILRGNYLFRTIPIEAGRHQVRLTFKSKPFGMGLVLSIFTLALATWFVVRKSAERTNGPKHDPRKRTPEIHDEDTSHK